MTKHPLDEVIDDLADVQSRIAEVLASDGEISNSDRDILREVGTVLADVSEYRKRQNAAESFERNGMSRHVAGLFGDHGFKVIELRPGAISPDAA